MDNPPGPAVRPRWRRERVVRWSLAIAMLLAVAAGVRVLASPSADRETAPDGLVPSVVTGPGTGPAPVDPTGAATPSPGPTDPTAVPLRLPGPVPSAGTGTFSFDTTAGAVHGRAGELRRYRVAVEGGAGEDVAAFAAEVDRALADERSWIGSGRLRLRRVPAGTAHDFTVYLATARTTRRMCAAGSVNIQVNGRPYASCRTSGRVILNLDRWRLSVPHFVAAKVPLATYRAYLVNHEVGHELGYRHERCPRSGRPAPVMMQQTLFLHGCLANPWPYLNGRRYAGPLR